MQDKQPKLTQGKKSNTLYIILVLAVIAALLLYLKFRNREHETTHEGSSIPVVRVMTAKPDEETVTLTLPGFLVAYNVTPILARTNGYLKNFYVDIGDHVKANQLLCEIETPDIDAAWEQAKAQLQSYIAKRDIAKITAGRWSGLFNKDSKSISKEEVDQTGATLSSADADVDAARADLERWEVIKNFKYIYAPFDGIVVERNIDIGSLISVGNESLTQPYTTGFETLTQPLFKISNTEALRVFVDVPQPYFPYIKEGIEAQITVPEFQDRIFKGVINRDAFALDEVARTLLTQINIENKDNVLRPGLYTEVKFTFDPYRDTFNIPISAIIIRNGPPFVAILNDEDTVSLQQVRIGKDHGRSVQIIKGIKEGDRIVINPSFRIREGTKVKVKKSL